MTVGLKLAICIPTYNRGEFIEDTLRSILSQIRDEVEVVISDNASQDNTQQLVEEYEKLFPSLTYFRWEKNMGFDRNILKAVELASAEYCWLMGSDDVLEPGGINSVLKAIKMTPNLCGLSVNRITYNSNMKERVYEPPESQFGRRLERNEYFSKPEQVVEKLGQYLGYISAQIVRRSLWTSVVTKSECSKYMNAYIHVYVIAQMLLTNSNWFFLSNPCVGYRSGNDSLLIAMGTFRRLKIDIVGFEKIIGDIFGRGSRPYKRFMNKQGMCNVRGQILVLKLHGDETSYWNWFSLCMKYYWRNPKFWITVFPLLCLPKLGIKLLRSCYRLTLKPLVVGSIKKNSAYKTC